MMTTMGDIEETLDRFIQAFNNLRLGEMVACYTDDATAFFPVAHHHARLEGREAIRGAFERVLGRIKSSGAKGMSLDPEDTLIKTFGDAAIVTFHIRDDDLSRRTLVLRKEGDDWGIEHLHASNAPLAHKEEA
jgi:ketosteroid isomerase-like protein